ncbi:MAG: hypothetical protein HC927_03940 [Deltaproteobacteria bacterium]|nr:hypothetical protein [Deltaproteobacteria bacterium]
MKTPATALILSLLAAAGQAQSFTIAHIPDTQKAAEFQNKAWTFVAIAEEIASLREERNIAFVTHTGDIVQNGTVLAEWERADFAMNIIQDAGIPYAAVIGNHDWQITSDKASGTSNFLAFFGPARYAGEPWYGGADQSGLNHYQIFAADGLNFLHLTIEWRPETEGSTVFAWASRSSTHTQDFQSSSPPTNICSTVKPTAWRTGHRRVRQSGTTLSAEMIACSSSWAGITMSAMPASIKAAAKESAGGSRRTISAAPSWKFSPITRTNRSVGLACTD